MTIKIFSWFPLAVLVAQAHAVEFPSIPFSHHDWEIACDNTRTCRAAGYQSDDADRQVTILLTRRAGPSEPTRIQLQLGHADGDFPRHVQMRIDGRAFGEVILDDHATGDLSPAQTAALLAALPTTMPLTWTSGGETWTVSTKGSSAVLLKMDEFQGRVGTPTALIRKGPKPESGVAPPLAAPEIRAARVIDANARRDLVPAAQRASLLAALRTTISKDEMAENSCEHFEQNTRDPAKIHVYRLSGQYLLVSTNCWTAAYNMGDGYWVVNAKPPYAPVLITTSGTAYIRGTISSWQKGRGIGDCVWSASWIWDGRRFSRSAALSTGMCKYIALGGAWELPVFVSKLVKDE